MLRSSGLLRRSASALYPDLADLGVQAALDGDRPAVRMVSAHPYCRGFAVDGRATQGPVVALDLAAGPHEIQVAARTDYGPMAGHVLRYQVGGAHGRLG